ncbi:MAG: hypothetical protein AAGA68_09360 [Pseudomonadota bacterium]
MEPFGKSHLGGNVVLRVRPKCAQLFFVFAGAQGQPGMPSMIFLHKSGLAKRNLVLLRDPYTANFARGVGGELRDIWSLMAWQRKLLERLAHVEEVFCVGNSMGAYAACLFGHLLGVREVFAFGLEIARAADPNGIERLAEMLESYPTDTRHHLYYVSHNDSDRANALALRRGSGVELHPIHAREGQDEDDSPLQERSHMVMNYLARENELREVFPPFRPAAAQAAH